MSASDEATETELDMAREQGKILGKALDHMVNEVADDGQEKQVDHYLVGYAIEEAEGMYRRDENGELVWHEREAENIHIEVSVRDAADGRFVPNLTVHARLIDSQKNIVGSHRQPYIWHPWLSEQGHSPFVWSVIGGIAQATATAASMMPGRFFLGVGTGENLNEHILADRCLYPGIDGGYVYDINLPKTAVFHVKIIIWEPPPDIQMQGSRLRLVKVNDFPI